MADIDVVKKGSRTWLWVLMVVVLALVLWFVMAGNNTPQTGSMLDGENPLSHMSALLAV